MSNDLQFDEGTPSITSRRPKIKKKSFADRLIGWGLAKDEAQANLWLIGIIVIGFGLIIYINIGTFGGSAQLEVIDDPTLGTTGV